MCALINRSVSVKIKIEKIILNVLSKRDMTTNQLKKTVESKRSKLISWYRLMMILNDLEGSGKIERSDIELGKSKIFIWKKR